MDIFTLYVGQGDLSAVRCMNEAIVIDSYMADSDHVSKEQIEASLNSYLAKCVVRGLVLTGFDNDHACPAGVDSILTNHEPDWVMYPKYYKDTDSTREVFKIIAREEKRRANTARPLRRVSVRVDKADTRRLEGLTVNFSLELFSPHMDDMDSSNNCSIVLKATGETQSGFSYLITGDTEKERWENINRYFGDSLRSEVLSAPHHGSITGVHPASLLNISPNTVLISAGVDNQYGHPDPEAVAAYQRVAEHVFATNVDGGTCLFTCRKAGGFETHLVRHPETADSRR
ncbi:MAG: hypothetical protein IH991_01240 [Planctomycetes bacterium]|nr:hypothetical protein [Planctomycetota bacterium]